jgi:hypothetical protein
MGELIHFKFMEDDFIHEGMIQLLDGTGDYAYKTKYGTYLTYNTGERPLRIFRLVKPKWEQWLAQLVEVI